MPVSPQAAALRSRPGYAPRTAHKGSFGDNYPKMPTLPTLPTLPNLGSAPNAHGRGFLTEQFGKLGEKYNPQLTGAQGQAEAALAGYGGWSWQEDDPNTPEREDLLMNPFDPNARLGQKEKGAVREVKNAANAQGMLNSSFANQNIGAALQRMSIEAQGIANSYASAINGIYTNWSNEASDISGDLVGLYGADAQWLAENPPPPPQPVTPDTQPERTVWTGQGSPNLGRISELQQTENVWLTPGSNGGTQASVGGSRGAGRRIWRGKNKPSLSSLWEQQGNQPIRLEQRPDGSWEAYVPR